MKKATELFKNYFFGLWQKRYVMDEDGFTEALAEHDKEFKDLIDEMIKEYEKKKSLIEGQTSYKTPEWWDLYVKIEALTELKKRLAYCKQVGE